MDHFKAAWGVVKENLLQWVIFAALLSVLLSFAVGIFLLPNFFRSTRRAIEQRQAPDFAELFNFDHIADDAVVMLIYAAAIFVGSFLCGIGSLVAAVLFFWMPMLAAEGRMEPVDTLKASLAHAKSNLGGILVFIIVAWLINMVASLFCLLPVLVTAPMTYVAMWMYFDAERDEIYRLAAAEGIQLRG